MISYTVGNLLSSDKEALVNTVNLEGFMGKGIAYQFKKQFPKNNDAYIKACRNKDIGIGKVFTFEEDGKIIINFPTKDKWREKTKLEYIKEGLNSLKETIRHKQIKSIAIPPLGCGNGGLDWVEVKPIIENSLSGLNGEIDILIYEPSKNFTSAPKKLPKTTLSHLLVLGCMRNLNFISSTSIQKTVFMLNLFAKTNFFKFEPYKHGPYSYSVGLVHKQICEFLEYYSLQKDKRVDLTKALSLLYKKMASKNIEEKVDFYGPLIKKTCKLCNSLNNVMNIEIAATILHIVSINGALTKEDVVKYFFKYPKEDISKFYTEEILNITNILINEKALQVNIFGEISINQDF